MKKKKNDEIFKFLVTMDKMDEFNLFNNNSRENDNNKKERYEKLFGYTVYENGDIIGLKGKKLSKKNPQITICYKK